MKKLPDVSVIILSYNTSDLTLSCLSSLSKTEWGMMIHETVLVDNASKDDTVARVKKGYPDVKVRINATNIGFAAGNNVGIRQASGRYVLLLNSDTEVEKDAIPAMVRFMDSHPDAGVGTCTVLLPDGKLDPASHRGFPTPWSAFTYMSGLERLFPRTRLFGGYHLGYLDLKSPHMIDCPSGAFFMVRREVLDSVGLLDEAFFMYGEDIDWAYRIREAGWKIWFNPGVSILHKKKQSGRSHNDRELRKKTQRYFLETMRLFYRKHYEARYWFIVTRLVYLAIAVKLLFMRFT